ncbi:alpha/beta hydrolase [Mycolicibacterium monacense]|uniref:Esterase n=1 Tax=Mycolicibacterium monacense TaxID=85693 RepID=A0AAD1N1H4_MYCMB|nr:alpha/beta hydrolase [Mycolicibacterium monacense]MDA4104274.1 esterase [Mycolicibacterium monacense DSM 44395]OBB62968.1 esterase [Mycolicibacterium monacense]ORB24649.1 esterase [Mycolicibacterium monacense DSM 44395]QHP84175.1 alpha/beta hydrolase [Mycolicibacterium monacense DSM 44395]BBZ63097.1 esterase [Mycolicibacterium monacense]
MTGALDPQIADLIEGLDRGFPPVQTMTGAQARATIRSRFIAPAEPEPVAAVEDRSVGEIPIRIYHPAGAGPLPVLVYAHGGGFVFCDLDSHDGLCRDIANQTAAIVVSVDYRLAPEHPWPAAAEDVYAVTRWVADNCTALGADPGRIAVGGDSAGGNLAAVTALIARDRGGPSLVAQLLVYPMVTPDFTTESYRLFGSGYYNPAEALRWYWDQYVPNDFDRTHPYVSPLHADLSGLPPAVVVIAGHDPLRDEGVRFGEALSAAGVPTVVRRFDGGIHGFMTMPSLELAQTARAQLCQDAVALLTGVPAGG